MWSMDMGIKKKHKYSPVLTAVVVLVIATVVAVGGVWYYVALIK
jgi:hypothetical protein